MSPTLARTPAMPAEQARQSSYRTVLASSPDDLTPLLATWQDLAANAIEPNPFYEPWHVLPALRLFGSERLTVVLVFNEDTLCGFFPLQARRLHWLAPLRVLESWHHLYGFLTTPLIRRDHAQPVLDALFDWFGSSPLGASLWHAPLLSGDGPFAQALTEACYRRQRPTFLSEAYLRALLIRAENAETYLVNALSKKRLRELRRKDRVLALKGRFEHRELLPGADTAFWAEQFLRLEAAGWKGREQSAFACHPDHAAFFREMLAAAHAAGRLQMLGLFLHDRAIALKINFLAPPGGFAFKIAFDEELFSQSPGVVLEVDNIERLHDRRELHWMDSCALPNHKMIDRLWTERRTIQDLWIGTGRKPGDLLVSLMPLARWVKRSLRWGPRPTPSPVPSPEE